MPCSSTNMHSHKGATNCHPISQKHKNEETRMYHEMAIQQSSSNSIESSDETNESLARVEINEKQIKQLKSAFRKLLDKITSRNSKMFMPIITVIGATDSARKVVEQYRATYPENNPQVNGYEKGFKSIWDYTKGCADINNLDPKKANDLIDSITKRAEVLISNPKSRKKGTAEYGELSCYWTYLKNLEKMYEAVYKRTEGLSGMSYRNDSGYSDVSSRRERLLRRANQTRNQ